jgi:hypothetical protein
LLLNSKNLEQGKNFFSKVIKGKIINKNRTKNYLAKIWKKNRKKIKIKAIKISKL